MGLRWSSESECVDAARIPELCAEMHARHTAFAKIDHWSLVSWYRGLSPDGTLRNPVNLPTPLCVVPRAEGGGYLLVNDQGEVAHVLRSQDVAEFEDTLYCLRTLSRAWQSSIATHSPFADANEIQLGRV